MKTIELTEYPKKAYLVSYNYKESYSDKVGKTHEVVIIASNIRDIVKFSLEDNGPFGIPLSAMYLNITEISSSAYQLDKEND
mgnify:CR=1 FL=1